MKKKSFLLFIVLSILWTSCGEKKKEKVSSKNKTKKVQKTEKSQKNKNTKNKVQSGMATVDEYVKLWKETSTCKFSTYGLDFKCPAYKKMIKLTYNKSKEKNFWKKIKKKAETLIFDTSPQVRYLAVGKFSSIFAGGVKQKHINLLLKLAKTEKNPVVYYEIIRVLGSSSGKSKEVEALLFKALDHPDKRVRLGAISALTAWLSSSKKAYDKIVEKIEKDKNIDVRATACQYAYRFNNDDIIKIYKKYIIIDTKDLEKDKNKKKLYSKCFVGLISLWSNNVLKNPSEKAYDLTLKLLSQKPRTTITPPWEIIPSLGSIPKIAKTKEVPKWYKKEKIVKILLDLMLDKNFNWIGRTNAARSLGNLGAKKELENALKKLEPKKDFYSKHVVTAIKRVLPKIK